MREPRFWGRHASGSRRSKRQSTWWRHSAPRLRGASGFRRVWPLDESSSCWRCGASCHATRASRSRSTSTTMWWISGRRRARPGGARREHPPFGVGVAVCRLNLVVVAFPSYLAEHGAPRAIEDLTAHRVIARRFLFRRGGHVAFAVGGWRPSDFEPADDAVLTLSEPRRLSKLPAPALVWQRSPCILPGSI